LWNSTSYYKVIETWSDYEEIVNWSTIERRLGYYDPTKFGHVKFHWSNVHASLPESE
jgi:hypothetical protein